MPEQSVDPRIRRSRDALEAALRDLILDRDLAQISVSDVTKHAGVNRSTFYEHYTDVQDLAARACATRFDELVAATPMFDLQLAESPDLPQNPLSGLVDHVAANAELYRTLLVADGSARLINHLLHRITVAAYANRHATEPGTHAADPDEVPHDPESALVAGAVLGVLIDWLRRGCPGTPAELADAVWPRLVAAASVTGLPKPAARRPARKPARNAAPKAAQKAAQKAAPKAAQKAAQKTAQKTTRTAAKQVAERRTRRTG